MVHAKLHFLDVLVPHWPHPEPVFLPLHAQIVVFVPASQRVLLHDCDFNANAVRKPDGSQDAAAGNVFGLHWLVLPAQVSQRSHGALPRPRRSVPRTNILAGVFQPYCQAVFVSLAYTVPSLGSRGCWAGFLHNILEYSCAGGSGSFLPNAQCALN